MDKKYIKMCDCKEVQGQWEPKAGDWFYSKTYGTLFVIDKEPKAFLEWQDGLHPKEQINWLPRQEDIQEMIPRRDDTTALELHIVFDAFLNEIYPEHALKGMSMTQLWLMFYMYEVHDKVWTGEKWEKAK